MKGFKYQILDTSLYDFLFIENHLTEMAARGWYLGAIRWNAIWVYRRSEPRAVRYAVTYSPAASVYNSGPTQAEEDLADICAEAGWKKVANMAQLQIFRNDDPNAVPLETDERQRLATMRKTMMRHYVPQNLLMAGLFLLQLVLNFMSVSRSASRTLSNPLIFVNLFMSGVLVLSFLSMALGALHWMRRAEKAVDAGLPCPPDRFYRRFRWVYWLILVGYLVLLLGAAGFGMVAGTLIMTCAMIACVKLTMSLCKACSAPRWVNIAVPIAANCILMMVLSPMLTPLLNANALNPSAPLPLSISSLVETTETHSLVIEEQTSLAVGYGRYLDETTDNHQISYTVVDVRMDAFYDLCLNDMERTFLSANLSAGIPTDSRNQRAIWDAEYARHAPSATADRWFICWEDRIVYLYATWTLTEEQIDIVTEILKP